MGFCWPVEDNKCLQSNVEQTCSCGWTCHGKFPANFVSLFSMHDWWVVLPLLSRSDITNVHVHQQPFISIPVILIVRGLLFPKRRVSVCQLTSQLACQSGSLLPASKVTGQSSSQPASQTDRQAVSRDTSKMVSVMSKTESNLTPSFHYFFMADWILPFLHSVMSKQYFILQFVSTWWTVQDDREAGMSCEFATSTFSWTGWIPHWSFHWPASVANSAQELLCWAGQIPAVSK